MLIKLLLFVIFSVITNTCIAQQCSSSIWLIKASNNKLSPSQAARVIRAVGKQKVKPALLYAIMHTESTFNPKAVSSHHAKGIMQVMPSVHKDKLKGRDPFDIETSIDVGSKILTDCMNKNNGDLPPSLVCYSGGSKSYPRKVIAAMKMFSKV